MAERIDIGRRRFLTGRTAAPPPVRPPWSRASTIEGICTGCGACVTHCPQGIVLLDPDGLPAIDFRNGECTFCGECVKACAEPVFDRELQPFPHVAVIGGCLTQRGVVCRSCGDVCPVGAIRFRPRMGAPALPELSPDACTGCGACLSACPVDAITVAPRLAEPRHA